MDDPQLLTDVALELVDSRALSIYRVRRSQRRLTSAGRSVRVTDFDRVSGRDNLGQAMTVRLLTPRGELAALGHPTYGSRLHEIVGAPNTETTRYLAKLFVIDALKQERRIDTINAVDVEPHPTDRFAITIRIEVKPVGADTLLALAPFVLEL
jgi:phage baseplate assembly protein W